jgi:threonine/homoserine efflux transporter RhtA
MRHIAPLGIANNGPAYATVGLLPSGLGIGVVGRAKWRLSLAE